MSAYSKKPTSGSIVPRNGKITASQEVLNGIEVLDMSMDDDELEPTFTYSRVTKPPTSGGTGNLHSNVNVAASRFSATFSTPQATPRPPHAHSFSKSASAGPAAGSKCVPPHIAAPSIPNQSPLTSLANSHSHRQKPIDIPSEFFSVTQVSTSKRRRESPSPTDKQHRSKKHKQATPVPENPKFTNTDLEHLSEYYSSEDDDEDEWGGGRPLRPFRQEFNKESSCIDQIIYRKDAENQVEKTNSQKLRDLLDLIPLEDRAPMGIRKRRLVCKKELDDDDYGNDSASENGVDGKFDDGMADEDAIAADRAKIDEAAKRLGCKRAKKTFTRKEEIITSDARGEAVAVGGQETSSSSVTPGNVTPVTAGNGKEGGLFALENLFDGEDESMRLRPPAEASNAPPAATTSKAKGKEPTREGESAAPSPPQDDMEWISGDQLGKIDKSKQFRDVVEVKEMWRIPGMVTPLLDHQVLGVDWMIARELSEKVPRGGLVADAMGLGKTIQSVATMALNKPVKTRNLDDPMVTLIIAPVALLQQWKSEIESYTRPRLFDVYIHHGPDKVRSVRSLQKKDVVITSYSTVMQSYPSPKRPRRNMSNEEYNEWWEEQWEENRGIFHRMKFWRVILDESHIIKNRYARTSLACQALEAYNTWALSGTPIQNSLDDIFPVFRLIKHPHAGQLDNFNAMVNKSDDGQKNARRVQAILRGCMMRRKKDDLLMGQSLITLPKKRTRMVQLEFSDEERSLYNAVETMTREKMNRFMAAGTVLKNYQHVLTMLLRLRQICNHPYLILDYISKDFSINDLDRALRIEEGEDLPPPDPELDLDALPEMSVLTQSVRNIPSASKRLQQPAGRPSGLRVLLEAARMQPAGDVEECAICLDNMESPVMTDCRHVYCRECITNLITRSAQSGNPGLCPMCKREVKQAHLKPFRPDQPNRSGEWNSDESEAGESENWLDNVAGQFLPSAKTTGMRDQLLEWRENHPDDKVVLFSQFVKMLDIVEKVTDEEGWGVVRYQGSMSLQEREDALHEFRTNPDVWIMLTSLKAGGVGLNLTHANLVISLDLWWNAAMEVQAFDRVHRMGQHKEVFITRFIVKNTVEQRILGLQREKQRLADAAMGEGEGRLGRLSVRELLGLFGRVVDDGQGRMHVEADYGARARPRFTGRGVEAF
ncbi:hypothetical protein RUND412_010225 [Rhizina undulata]